MSEKKPKDKRYIGKIRNIKTTWGIQQRIFIDNLNSHNEDGTPNQYYKGTLAWIGSDGTIVQIKQMDIGVPKDGFSQAAVDNGTVGQISFDLNNEYDVKKID